MKQKYTVNIAGTDLTIISDETEEYVRSLSQILDRRIMDLVIVKNRCSKLEAILISALDYLDNTMKQSKEIAELKAKIDELEKK